MKEALNFFAKRDVEVFAADPWIKERLEELNKYSYETYQHSIRVAHLASRVANHLFYPSYQKSVLVKAALLHDIGKTKIPLGILEAGKLTEEEKKQIDRHVRESFETVKEFDPMVAKVIIGHHEFQPKKYPRSKTRITEEMLVKELQYVLALCDSVDALMSKRTYKKPFSTWEVAEELEGIFKDPLLIFWVTLKRQEMNLE